MSNSNSPLTGGRNKHTHTFPPLEGKPTDDDLLAIKECLLPLLMVNSYDQLKGIHSLTAILTEDAKYEAEHGNAQFVLPVRLHLYDKNIADNATTVVRVRAEAAHKSCLDDYASFEAAGRGVAKFLRDVVDEIWYNDLKDADTFYTKVTAIEGLPAVDRTWRAWKVAFRLAHLKRQRQLQVSGGGDPLRGAHSILPAPAATIDRLGTALDLTLAAANNTTILQQLTSANLALTTSNATLTAANKKLLEALAKVPATTPGTP